MRAGGEKKAEENINNRRHNLAKHIRRTAATLEKILIPFQIVPYLDISIIPSQLINCPS